MLKNWFFADYDKAVAGIDRDVIARFSRGNVLIQEGRYITQGELESLSRKADKALADIQDSEPSPCKFPMSERKD